MTIEVEGVHFSYNHTPVLRDVSFSVSSKDLVTIVGPNGGGKTTLLKLLMGLLLPQRGTIRIDGEAPERARKRIGYVPQYANFDPRFPITVLEVVKTGRMSKPLGFYRRSDREAALKALSQVGIEKKEGEPFQELSGGQKQRVLIARALAGEPELLFLDEPTANVDPGVESQFSFLLKELNRDLTILLVTHDMGFVSSLTSRVLCVNHTVREHPTAEVAEESLSGLYGNSVKMVRHDVNLADRNPDPDEAGESRLKGGACFDE